ncbi:hypothetical protein GCM10011512_19640 [Tersicoccus solisilvae]|uniref:DUF4062 domain-containing protein n=1 Tax=Tersicoccus solisilvae TaxID=1882339 RepID=A0ABQ1P9C6_9MICC|nr:DUF4062 domain-containing protein [Tersicoccus solisilvae]GGC92638.1 hypothetical protein GCM10011512_19640 [Tersicoccus solisilvae]
MATKYQVFVSSTFDDLKHERDTVIKAILEMGHIPVGMEMFSAADEEQWKIIARHIDESDYYCVIIAHRYGSTVNGVSYTQKEYEYAAARGVPVMGFVLDDSSRWPGESMDRDSESVVALNKFKALVKSKPVSFWNSAEDLYGKVSIALSKAFTANPRDGWVRASAAAGPEVTQELTRLSSENSRLREEVLNLQAQREIDKSNELEAMLTKFEKIKRSFDYKYRNDNNWVRSDPISLDDLFFLLAPSLATEVELSKAAADLAMQLREDRSRPWYLVAVNQVRDLLSDLRALGVVAPSPRKHAVADSGEYWSLTDLGRELDTHIRLMEIEARAAEPTEKPEETNSDVPEESEQEADTKLT